LRTSGTVHDGRVRNYLSQPQDCRACTLKRRCTRAPFKKIARDINEDARNHARSLKGTPEFERSSNARKKVEMRFAHLKVQHGFERMRLRGLTGARDEFHLAANQDDGAAPTRPANSWSVCVNCVRGLAGRFRCSPINRQRPTWNRPESLPKSKANYSEAFFDSIDPERTSSSRGRSRSQNGQRAGRFLASVFDPGCVKTQVLGLEGLSFDRCWTLGGPPPIPRLLLPLRYAGRAHTARSRGQVAVRDPKQSARGGASPKGRELSRDFHASQRDQARYSKSRPLLDSSIREPIARPDQNSRQPPERFAGHP
jgi:Transposase DDE domain